MKIGFPNHKKDMFNDPEGFDEHCEVAALIIREMGISPHTKHHIRTAIREATHKVTEKKGSRKATAHFMSQSARRQMEGGCKDDLMLEHVVPVSHINQLVLSLAETRPVTGEDIARIILDWTCLALITKDENSRLTIKTVPPEIHSNKFARYALAEPPIHLQPNLYKELQHKSKGAGK